MVRYETSWQRTRLDDRTRWASRLLDLLYVEPRARDLSPVCSMGVIRFWSSDTREGHDVFLVRRDYAEGGASGRLQVLVPAPGELWDPWGSWGSWRVVDTEEEALAVICDELDNLSTRQVKPVVWTLHERDGVVARLVATCVDYPGLAGHLEPVGRFERWSQRFAFPGPADDLPGLTMFDHTGVQVPSYRIEVDGERVYWYATHPAGDPV